MKTVACYIRVSTENQLDNYSIEEQTERLEAYCKAKDYIIHKFYTDGGYSGGNTNRPALQECLRDIRSGFIEAVIVYKLDRLSRSQKDTLSLIEDEFLANHVDFISVCENFDTTTPFGRAMIGILSVFAQLEKDQITERFTMGRIGRGKAGYFHGGGNAPKGYTYQEGELHVNPLEAQQVQRVFELFLSGMSINAISRRMGEEFHNDIWNSAGKVSGCLKNSLYTGKVKFAGVEYSGRHEAIISEEEFEAANRLLTSAEREAAKTSAQKTPFRAGYLLSSIVYCARCGARYSANHGYYKCYSRSKSSKKFITDPSCRNDNWKIEDLDELVIGEIQRIAVDGSYMKLLNTKKTVSIEDLHKEIDKADAAISRLLELYQISAIPISQIKEKVEALQVQKQELQNMIIQEKQQDHSAFIAAVESFLSVIRTGSLAEKRLVVATIVQSVLIDGTEVEVKWRV